MEYFHKLVKRAREEVKMGENEKKCNWTACEVKTYGAMEHESAMHMRDHVELCHMPAMRKHWNATLNAQNEEIA